MLISLSDRFSYSLEVPGCLGARIVNHLLFFHLSRCLRAAARAFALNFFAIRINSQIAGATPLATPRPTWPI